MEPRKFQYIGGNSRKFWEIYEPEEVSGTYGPVWIVRVRFGRLGTWGQERNKLFKYKTGAAHYYNEKLSEKLHKGYKEHGKVTVKKNVADYTPMVPAPKQAPVCSHATLQTCGQGKWKCVICKKEIDFGSTDILMNASISTVQSTVRRFFAEKSE